MPRLDEEFDLIRKMYFKGRTTEDEIDPLERLDRMNARKLNKR